MKKLLQIATIFLAALGAGRCQTYEVSASGGVMRMGRTPLGSLNTQDPVDDDTTFRNGYTYGLRFTYNTRGYYGHEFGYSYTRVTVHTRVYDTEGNATPAEGRAIIHQAAYNFLIYFMPRGERWRPFITGGLEAHRYGNPRIPGWTGLPGMNYGANYGGGVKIKLMEHASIRLDLRDEFTGKPYRLSYSEGANPFPTMRQMEASFGIAIGF